jgi:hypothetical protein
MHSPQVNKIVDAVLYEGYILYPYRSSAQKNRQRFTFGRVYPRAYSDAEKGAEPFLMQTQCLATTQSEEAGVEVTYRFLHLMTREILRLPEPLLDLRQDLDTTGFETVPELQVDGQRYLAWEEATEGEIALPVQRIQRLCNRAVSSLFTFNACESLEPIRNGNGAIAGLIRRRQSALSGEIELSAEPLSAQLMKITAAVLNHTFVPERELGSQRAVLARTFASTHTVLHLEGAEFVSLMDPPLDLKDTARACRNEGTWPVLVGDEETGERSTMLSSPIILYDYPRIAPESPGELFDGTEIDEILTLRVMTMTDSEKEEMRQTDERARQILERTESLSNDDLLKMHGVLRELRPFDHDIFGSDRRLAVVLVHGLELRAGDRVKIRPKARADIMDIALDGKTAVIEAIEEDAESRIHLALVIDEDPGKDLGYLRQPGHRFFYGLDEVEPLGELE